MKKILSLFLCLVALFSLATPCFALADTAEPQTVLSEEITTEDGFTIERTIVIPAQARSSTRKVDCVDEVKKSGTLIAVIGYTVTFRFDGKTVSVASKSITQTDTYDGWTFTLESFTASGGTVTLKGTLSKLLNPRYAFVSSVSCDKDGNIT